MDNGRLRFLLGRAIGLLNLIDENKPEQAIRLVNMARSDLLDIREAMATPHEQESVNPYTGKTATGYVVAPNDQ